MDAEVPLTFEFEGKLVGIVEREHLLVGRLLVGVEDQLCGEHKHRKASLHQLRLPVMMLHWHVLHSVQPSSRSRCSPPGLHQSQRPLWLCNLPPRRLLASPLSLSTASQTP